jgi:fatty acid elongase 3
MKERKAYSLKFFSQVHNVILTLLSAAMFGGAAYGAYLKYNSQGFYAGLLCEQESDPMHGILWYWSYIFYLSKYYEFIDTYLLILKKVN